MDLIELYKAERMEEGKKIEANGIKKRKEFLSTYPIESIANLTIEQYLPGTGSFSHWLRYELRDIASMGNCRPKVFGVYTTQESGSTILLSSSYKDFGSDYEKAFIYLKKEISNFLEDIRQENYYNFEKYNKIDSSTSNNN